MENLIKCRLCMDVLKGPKQLPCFHSFCSLCLSDYESKFTVDEGFYCPICGEKFLPDNKAACNETKFLSRMVKTDTRAEKSFCSVHPNVEINFFCVDCESMGCPVCSTGYHDKHNCIDLQEMAAVVKEEMRSMSRDIHRKTTQLENEIEAELKTKKEVLDELDLTSKEIKEKAEYLEAVIKRQAADLLKQVSQVKSKCMKDMENFKMNNKKSIDDDLEYFNSYVKAMLEHATEEELIDSVRNVKRRTEHIKMFSLHGKERETTSAQFIPSNLHIDTLSLLGHIELQKKIKEFKKPNSNLETLNTASTIEKVPGCEDVDGRNVEESLRNVPKVVWKKCKETSCGVAAIAVGRGEFFVAVENSGDILRFDLTTLKEKPASERIHLPDLDTPWDMTTIISDELSHTYVFILDNLHGKIHQINVPFNPSIGPPKFIMKSWLVPLNETLSLSSNQDRLLIAGVTNKILEYSLSSLLIISSSSSSSLTGLTFPEPTTSFSVIPPIRDILHASRLDDSHFVTLFDHLYELCGVFLVNEWGKMVKSFGEGRGSVAHLQVDYPVHAALDRKEPTDSDHHSHPSTSRPYNDSCFIFVCDANNGRISLFDGDLTFLTILDDNIMDAWRLAIDPLNKLLFVATLNNAFYVIKYQ
ncbi:hypothetical protein HELRODRAFT_193539 [Helobdella robusta]|uniref:RING-type domain-containing protein n=1 Tax=Helobdella robusta TaxID=6412 RepID=T1FV38_HELRO|nr:hypothetical protein HELRODRAFT_193539 [Helobdella robusta]ESN95561.1 hypothetical protein HELRODRAFT_193539 [Helobdella robusta]